jgi:hypothetical protein
MSTVNTEPPSALEELARDPGSRKEFLKKMGGGAAGASAFALFLTACGSKKKAAAGSTATEMAAAGGSATGDLAIVNYALTLEYLEADFYGKVLTSSLFKGAQQSLLQAIHSHEVAHVAALKSTVEKLGGTPAAKPKTKFPLGSAGAVVKLAATVENLGAAAYLGQADKIQSKEILAAAISIHSVEARHAAALNTLLGKSPTPDGAFGKPASMEEVLPQVKPFIVA